jgi:TPR repeat protein
MKRALLISFALFCGCVLAVYDSSGLEIDLRSSHGLLNSTTSISQETLQKIINGAGSGNKGNCDKAQVNHVLITISDNLYFLGLLKLYGITVTKDVDGAATAFESAAALGHADAQTALGVMKMKGLGTSIY